MKRLRYILSTYTVPALIFSFAVFAVFKYYYHPVPLYLPPPPVPIPTSGISPSPSPAPATSSAAVRSPGSFCGGFAGIACPEGFTCQLDGSYPDSGGTCVKKPAPLPTPVVSSDCKVSGCSHEICQDSAAPDTYSICLYKQEYSCLQYSVCERQSDGKCGWTPGPKYRACLQSLD